MSLFLHFTVLTQCLSVTETDFSPVWVTYHKHQSDSESTLIYTHIKFEKMDIYRNKLFTLDCVSEQEMDLANKSAHETCGLFVSQAKNIAANERHQINLERLDRNLPQSGTHSLLLQRFNEIGATSCLSPCTLLLIFVQQ